MYKRQEELSGLELMKLEAADKGVVKLSDVADIEMADNAEEMYAKINGNDGILLSLQKQSNASTAAVSHALQKAMDKLTDCLLYTSNPRGRKTDRLSGLFGLPDRQKEKRCVSDPDNKEEFHEAH